MKQESLKIIGVVQKTYTETFKGKSGDQTKNKVVIQFKDNDYDKVLDATVSGDACWADIVNAEPGVVMTFVCGIDSYHHEASGRYFTNARCWRVDDYKESGSTPAAGVPPGITNPVGESDGDLPF